MDFDNLEKFAYYKNNDKNNTEMNNSAFRD